MIEAKTVQLSLVDLELQLKESRKRRVFEELVLKRGDSSQAFASVVDVSPCVS